MVEAEAKISGLSPEGLDCEGGQCYEADLIGAYRNFYLEASLASETLLLEPILAGLRSSVEFPSVIDAECLCSHAGSRFSNAILDISFGSTSDNKLVDYIVCCIELVLT